MSYLIVVFDHIFMLVLVNFGAFVRSSVAAFEMHPLNASGF